MVERNSDPPTLTDENEGESPYPQFVFLDSSAGTLTIRPESGSLAGKTYAVFINGRVFVNQTIQEDFYTQGNYFEISIPASSTI